MAEYIDKVSFLQQERENYCKGCDSRNGLVCRVCEMNNVLNDIEDYQTADVVEVVHGRWIKKQGGFWETATCSNCGENHPTVGIVPNYCPNCGAKMDGERRSD